MQMTTMLHLIRHHPPGRGSRGIQRKGVKAGVQSVATRCRPNLHEIRQPDRRALVAIGVEKGRTGTAEALDPLPQAERPVGRAYGRGFVDTDHALQPGESRQAGDDGACAQV